MGKCLSLVSRSTSNAYEVSKTRIDLPVRKLPLHSHSILKDYVIPKEDSIIGAGASGPVRLIERRCSGEHFVLKILPDTPTARRGIELQFMASQHPNILPIVDVYENLFRGHPCLFIVTEYMSGGTLLERIKFGQIIVTEREVVRMIRDLGSAIEYLHSLGIIHHNIKLENVLYSKNGILKLADFGMAEIEREPLDKAPSYASLTSCAIEISERIRYDKSQDMWSLGIIMYFLLCGHPLLCRNSETDFSAAMREKISNGEYLFERKEWENVSLQAKSVLRKLLATNFEQRMTANELMGNAWIVQCSRALDIRLYESDFSNDSKWLDMMDILSEYINGICAINNDLLIKPIEEISNTLLTRRCEKENDDEKQTKKHSIQRLTPSSLDELGSSPLLQPA